MKKVTETISWLSVVLGVAGIATFWLAWYKFDVDSAWRGFALLVAGSAVTGAIVSLATDLFLSRALASDLIRLAGATAAVKDAGVTALLHFHEFDWRGWLANARSIHVATSEPQRFVDSQFHTILDLAANHTVEVKILATNRLGEPLSDALLSDLERKFSAAWTSKGVAPKSSIIVKALAGPGPAEFILTDTECAVALDLPTLAPTASPMILGVSSRLVTKPSLDWALEVWTEYWGRSGNPYVWATGDTEATLPETEATP